MIIEVSEKELNDLRFELRQLNTDLNGLFRSVNDGTVVATVRYLDQMKERLTSGEVDQTLGLLLLREFQYHGSYLQSLRLPRLSAIYFRHFPLG